MIHAEDITRYFGRRAALQGVTFRVKIGEAVWLAGSNGAGKTTLLRILAGYAPATSGRVRIAGHDGFGESIAARAATGYVPEGLPLYGDMRVGEYLRFRGRVRGMGGRRLRQRIMELSEQLGLRSDRGSLIGGLSRGQRARVALVDALLHEPRVLLLDDPLASLDAVERGRLVEVLKAVRTDAAMLMATHVPDEARTLFTRALFLRAGRLERDEPLMEDTQSGAALRDRMMAWEAAPSQKVE